MTFDDIIMSEPKLKLGEFIQLFLLGYDDKIYINLYDQNEFLIYEDCRIISDVLSQYYDRYINYLIDEESNVFCGVVLKGEDKNGK